MDSPPSPALDRQALAMALGDAGVGLGAPVQISQLAGGYSWRTYLVEDAGGGSVILRLAPRGGTLEPYDPAIEARAIIAAGRSVPAPRVLAVNRTAYPLGAAYIVQSTAPGRVLRLSAVLDPGERAAYRTTFARTLGALHRDGDGAALGDAKSRTEALHDELERMAMRYRRAVRWPRPGFEIGLRWLLAHVPRTDEPPTYCHGDFRFGNLSWTGPGRLGAVLDWERAWCGDPMCDIAFTRVYSGWCAVDGAAALEYERAGRVIDERRVGYGRRFERVRSYTASMLGAAAFLDGRSADARLLEIGAAGEAGMRGLVEWLAEGELPPLPAAWRVTATDLPVDALPDDVPAAVAALRTVPPPASIAGRLTEALAAADAAHAFRQAFGLIAPLAATGSSDALPVLRALVTTVGKVQTNG